MNDLKARLLASGEFFAAGFFEGADRTNFYRFAKATLRYREVCALPEYCGETGGAKISYMFNLKFTNSTFWFADCSSTGDTCTDKVTSN